MPNAVDSGRNDQRHAVGIWAEWPKGARWANEGMTRLLAFLIEGVARSGRYTFRIVLPDSIRDAAEEDLRNLPAEIGRDFTLHSPRDYDAPGNSFTDLAEFANLHVRVEAWLTLFPYFAFARLLEAPVTVIFPDAIPKTFPEYSGLAWGPEGVHLRWERDVIDLLSSARSVVTFSEHVAREHVHGIFGFPLEKVTVVPHAAPDLRSLLPFLAVEGRTNESLAQAAGLLRMECASRGWDYLRDFPFEQVTYLAVSTQDRVTKNIQIAARALHILLRERRCHMKMLMTAPLHFQQSWTVLPTVIEQTQSQFDVVAMADLPRREHAAFLHCAALVVHPSLFEGGHAPFPFYESVSVGTPCIMAFGPHVAELAQHEPGILAYCFDPHDAEGLADFICDIISRREEALADQRAIYARLSRSDWPTVADAYAAAALSAKGDELVRRQ